ncbi:hypothetical protein LJK88_08555 [Paenibacillus sp. P26]|nr:hypothetical protein LJK88_08555 [Paenibacillus sp. P26]
MKKKVTLGIFSFMIVAGGVVSVGVNAGTFFGDKQPVAQAASKQTTSIQDKMLNAIDYYKTVKGSYYRNIAGQKYTADFEVNEGSQPGSSVILKDEKGNVTKEVKSDADSILELNNQDRSYKKGLRDKNFDIPAERLKKNSEGQLVAYYRNDPAAVRYAEEVTFPQDFAFWMNNENKNYSIVGEEKYLDRKATVITGTLTDVMARKLKSDQFKFWVDSETGVLLKMITTSGGQEVNKIEVTSIAFDKDVDKTKFTTTETKGYKDKSPKFEKLKK